MDLLIELSNKCLLNISDFFSRYLTDEIDWTDHLISIVGGRGAGLADAYVAADGIEYGHANYIPLWLFGFLY